MSKFSILLAAFLPVLSSSVSAKPDYVLVKFRCPNPNIDTGVPGTGDSVLKFNWGAAKGTYEEAGAKHKITFEKEGGVQVPHPFFRQVDRAKVKGQHIHCEYTADNWPMKVKYSYTVHRQIISCEFPPGQSLTCKLKP